MTGVPSTDLLDFMAIQINNECQICGMKFMHERHRPQVCDNCLEQSREIEEYMDETGDWKGVMKKIKEMEANFLLSNAEVSHGDSRCDH